jgi:hypothetical protein
MNIYAPCVPFVFRALCEVSAWVKSNYFTRPPKVRTEKPSSKHFFAAIIPGEN